MRPTPLPTLPELSGYELVSVAQRCGPLATYLVKSSQSEQLLWAEQLDEAETTDGLFATVRRYWRDNVRRQPAGSLRQHWFHDAGHKLTRVIDAPRGSPLKNWIFTRQFDLEDALETAVSLTACIAECHRLSRLHVWLGNETIFRDARNRIELRDAPVFDLFTQQDFLALPIRDIAFLSPESCGSLARDLSPASDMYSVGVLLFSMLAGRPPIEATSASDYLDRQLRMECPRLRELRLSVPTALDDMVARLLRRDPRDRYETAAALLDDLRAVARSISAPPARQSFAIGTQDIRTTLTEPSLVGRETELEIVQRALNDARAGICSLQFIIGSEAICRRSFIDEVALRAKSQDMLVFRGGASNSVGATPLQSLESVLSTIVALCDEDEDLAVRIAAETSEHSATLAELLPALARLWPKPTGPTGPDAYGSQRAAVALEELLAAFGKETRAVALLVDDLANADELTRVVVRSLAYRIKQGRSSFLTCIVTSESPEPLDLLLGTPPINLGAMSDAAIELHLQSSAGKLADRILKPIVEASRGSSMMASAILGRLIDTKAILPSSQGWIAGGSLAEALQGDETIAQLLEQQIHALSPSALQTLATAAVIGQSFELKLLAHVSGASYTEVLEVTTDALGRRLLSREARSGCFRFAHEQIHRQLYRTLDAHERKQIHFQTAVYLEDHDPGNHFDLAFHYDAADEGTLALSHALQGARAARQRFSLSVAQSQLEIANRWVSREDRATALQICEALGEIHLLAGRYDQAAGLLQEAMQRAETPIEKAKVQQMVGELAFKRGKFDEAANHYESALTLCGLRVPGNPCTMLLGLVVQVFFQLLHSCLPAQWIATRGKLTDLDCLRLQLLSQLSRVYWFSRHKLWTLGNHLRSLNEAERFAPSATLAAFYSEHGPVMSLLRWFGRANRYAERSLAIRRLLGDRWGQGQSHHYHSVVMLAQCRFLDCIRTAMRAVEMLRQTGDFWEMNMARYQAANAMFRTGRLADAADVAAQMYHCGREIGDIQATGISLDVWARSAPHSLSLEQVAEEAARMRHDAQSHAQTQLAYAVCLLHHNRIDDAIVTLQGAIERCRAAGHMNTYISPCYAWLSTALRRQIETTLPTDMQLLQSRIRGAQRMVRTAVRIANSFPADQAHCLREAAILDIMHGRFAAAVRLLYKSLDSAQKYSQPIEEQESLKLLHGLHSSKPEIFGPLPAMLEARRRELAELHGKTLPQEASPVARTVNLSLADRFVTLLHAGRRIAQALSTSAVYVEASDAARRLLRGQHVDIVMVGRSEEGIELQRWAGAEPDRLRDRRIETHQTLIKLAATEQRAISAGSGEDGSVPAAGSCIATPISFRANTVAVILVSHDQLKGLFGSDELRIAEFVSTLAGAALENAEGFFSLQQMNDTLEQRVIERTQAAEERARQLASSNEQLRATEEQLRHAIVQANAANEAKGRFLATISHEIRTPLNGILGMTRLAQQTTTRQRQSGYLDVVQESGQSLLALINDLLDFSKLEAGKMELERIAVDPHQLAGEVCRLMASSAWQKGVEMVCDVGPDVPSAILGDPSRLRQIMMNLLGNAIKFTEHGFVALVIRTLTPDDGPAQLVIRVQDSGIGIAEDKQTKVFDSFSQADSSTTRRYGGTGLGLAICKELAEIMGGTITVQSRIGVGSTFTVALPLDALCSPVCRSTLTGRRIALIEPLAASRCAIEGSLAAAGAEVQSFADSVEATHAFFDTPWDLVIFGSAQNQHLASRCASREIPCLYLSPLHAELQVEKSPWSAELRKPAMSIEIIAVAEGLIRRDPKWHWMPSEISAAAPPGVRCEQHADDADTDPVSTDRALVEVSAPALSGKHDITSSESRATRILVAEDGAINQEVITGILEMQGYEVVIAHDGLDAVERATTERFAICLMDVDMPKMDGIEATRLIREQLAEDVEARMPIIAMTAHCGDQIWDECQRAGMDAFLPKPIHPTSLFEMIERYTSQKALASAEG